MSNEANFRKFVRELEIEEEREFKGRILEITKRIALDGFNGVVNKTAVDTGFAKNSWFMESGSNARGDATTALPNEAVLSQLQAFQPITIANGAEYIGFLEDGTSRMAPQPMVGPTLAELRSKYRQVR